MHVSNVCYLAVYITIKTPPYAPPLSLPQDQRPQLIPVEEVAQSSPSGGKRVVRGPASKGGGDDGGDSDNSQAGEQ